MGADHRPNDAKDSTEGRVTKPADSCIHNGVNEYSANWFDLFLRQIDPAQTAREIEFLCRQLQNAKFRSVLDVCCGGGRHAIWLSRHGYEVTAVDRDESVL